MAKSPTTRVHHLAKELGVPSKEIVQRCQEEGIPNITNHMSAVSVGLSETIREWYGSGKSGTATAVEPIAPVEKVEEKVQTKARRAKKKPARKKVTAKENEAAEKEAAEKPRTARKVEQPEKTASEQNGKVEEPHKRRAEKEESMAVANKAEPTKESKPVEPQTGQDAQPTMADEEQRPAAAASTEERAEQQPSGKAPEPTEDTASSRTQKPQINVPSKPENVAPAGPTLDQPKKVQLRGPVVVRVEQPEPMDDRYGKRPRRSGDVISRSSPRPGRGAGQPPAAAPPGESPRGRAPSRRNKRRSASARDDAGRTSGRSPAYGEQANWRDQDLLERENRLNRAGGFFKAHRRDNLKRSSTSAATAKAQTPAQTGGVVKIAEPIYIKDLSAASGIKSTDLLRKLLLSGRKVNINSAIDPDTAVELMLEYDIELQVEAQVTAEQQIVEQFKQREMHDERPRSPVVTILGHVDHGKTSLLDRIRNANVAEGEAGGITQATSAFRVPVRAGDTEHVITFIDTPGHEAFTEMRSRGAKVTDIVVLVVAADDGVMPQTVESINHAKAAGVPLIVALNKIDKPEATDSNIQRILGQLAEHDLNPAEWGGETELVRTSAIEGTGIQDLLEVLDYQAQLLDLKSDFGGPAQGVVLEASMQEGRGPVANVLVQHGQLKKGDFIVAGRGFGRVRDIVDDRAKRIDAAGPSAPVAISGIDEVPNAGDSFYVVKSLREAEAAAEERRHKDREQELAREKVTLDNIFQKLAESDRKELPLIVKADVHGSVDTLRSTLTKISTEDVTISIKHTAVGGINESDVLLAETAGAIIIGFNVTAPGKVRKLAEGRGVDIRLYDVIYDITDDVKKAAEGLLDPEHKLEVLGHAEVREVFRITKVGMVAGCYVTDGVVERNAKIRVTRGDIVIESDRRLEQLKRFKDDVKEVRAGQECGMKIEGYDDIKVGDVLECYRTLMVKRTL